MGNINTADGSSIKAIYDFLISINQKDSSAELIEFTVSIEDNVTLNKRNESFKTIDSFLERFAFVLDKIFPQCDIGPYFRLNRITLNTSKNNNTQKLKYFYDIDNKSWIEFHTIEKKSPDSAFWLTELINHSNRQEFLISLRKSRYVDPCYVDDKYIDEKYDDYQN